MPADVREIVASNVLPTNTFLDGYADFVSERSMLLEAEATKLLN